ncbi:MAG: ABC transporter ATP-binding protein, partial [Promethearchaeota archaeon]
MNGDQMKNDISEENNGKTSKLGVFLILKRLIKYVGKQNRRILLPLLLFISLNIIFSWISPLIFKYFIDQGLGSALGGGGGASNIDIILQAGILFFMVSILSVLSKIAQGYIIQKLATITMFNLRAELFTKFQYLGLDYHDSPKKSTGKKVSYLTNDVNTIQELINSGLLSIVANLFLIFGALGFMLTLSPHLTFISFLIIPVLFLIGGVILKIARKYFEELRERVSVVTATLDESIMGMKVIKSFAVEDENYKELRNATLKEKEAKLKTAKLNALIPGITTLVITFGLILLFFSAGVFIRDGLITIGTLVAFIFYLFQFFEPLIGTISFFTLLQNSIAAGGRILILLDEDPTIQDHPSANSLKKIAGSI